MGGYNHVIIGRGFRNRGEVKECDKANWPVLILYIYLFVRVFSVAGAHLKIISDYVGSAGTQYVNGISSGCPHAMWSNSYCQFVLMIRPL